VTDFPFDFRFIPLRALGLDLGFPRDDILRAEFRATFRTDSIPRRRAAVFKF